MTLSFLCRIFKPHSHNREGVMVAVRASLTCILPISFTSEKGELVMVTNYKQQTIFLKDASIVFNDAVDDRETPSSLPNPSKIVYKRRNYFRWAICLSHNINVIPVDTSRVHRLHGLCGIWRGTYDRQQKPGATLVYWGLRTDEFCGWNSRFLVFPNFRFSAAKCRNPMILWNRSFGNKTHGTKKWFITVDHVLINLGFITVYHVLINLGIDNAFSTWLDRCCSVAGTLNKLFRG